MPFVSRLGHDGLTIVFSLQVLWPLLFPGLEDSCFRILFVASRTNSKTFRVRQSGSTEGCRNLPLYTCSSRESNRCTFLSSHGAIYRYRIDSVPVVAYVFQVHGAAELRFRRRPQSFSLRFAQEGKIDWMRAWCLPLLVARWTSSVFSLIRLVPLKHKTMSECICKQKNASARRAIQVVARAAVPSVPQSRYRSCRA